jgi:hypothetical protein
MRFAALSTSYESFYDIRAIGLPKKHHNKPWRTDLLECRL